MKGRELGDHGERVAAEFLKERGYQITEMNVRTARGELDIVARDGEDLVFIEVKTRKSGSAVRGEMAMTPAKVNRIEQLAMAYLVDHEVESQPWRIEVITVETSSDEQHPRIALIRDLS